MLEPHHLILITNGRFKFVSHVDMIKMAGFAFQMVLVQQTNVVMDTKQDLKNVNLISTTGIIGITVAQKLVLFSQDFIVKENATHMMTFRQSVGTGLQLETKNAMTATQKLAMDATQFANENSIQAFIVAKEL